MAVTRGTLQIARRLRRDIGAEVDSAVRTLTGEWVDAWDRLAATWRAAAVELTAEAARLGHWPRPTDVARLDRPMAALDASERELGKLATITRSTAAEAADRAISLDAEVEPRLIASQAPATEQEGLLAHLCGRSLVAEQDRDQMQLLVLSRIRTDAVNVIRRRAEGQIASDILPLSDEATAAMRRDLIRGVDVGNNPRAAAGRMVAAVEGRFNGGLTRALTIARTETLDAYRATSQQIHNANADVVPGWQWLATLDRRTCPSCWAMDGQRFPSAIPGPDDHPQGRCARVPVLASWAELGITAPEPPTVWVDAQERFWSLPEADRLLIMGAGRLRMLQDGTIGFGDLSTLRQNPRWRTSRVPTPLRELRRRAAGRPAGPAPVPRLATPTLPAPAPASAQLALPPLRSPAVGRDVTAELDMAELDRQVVGYVRLRATPGQGDQVLRQIQDVNGFNGLPQLVNTAEMDALVASGRQPLYRGIQAEFVDPFKRGDHYPGLGVAGNGTYTTSNRDYALDYAKGDEAGLIRMTLHPEARITTLDEVEQLMGEEGIRPSRVAQQTLVDQGRWAAAHGYDAYRVPVNTRENEEYWVVLNRTALIVED